MNVTVTMSHKQAEVVAAACEEYLRLRLGQFVDLAYDIATIAYPDMIDFDKRIAERDELQDALTHTYHSNRKYITEIPEDALIAETVWLAIRSKLAWHDNPDGDPWDVRFDKVWSRCNEEIPEVKIDGE